MKIRFKFSEEFFNRICDDIYKKIKYLGWNKKEICLHYL